VLAVCAGSPVVSLVCARECAPGHDTATTADASEHCQQPEPADTPAFSAVGPDGCSLIGVRDIALRERTPVSAGAAPPAPMVPHVRDGKPPSHTFVSLATTAGRKRAGVSPGALLPLRI
jgi:hypothetical protein